MGQAEQIGERNGGISGGEPQCSEQGGIGQAEQIEEGKGGTEPKGRDKMTIDRAEQNVSCGDEQQCSDQETKDRAEQQEISGDEHHCSEQGGMGQAEQIGEANCGISRDEPQCSPRGAKAKLKRMCHVEMNTRALPWGEWVEMGYLLYRGGAKLSNLVTELNTIR